MTLSQAKRTTLYQAGLALFLLAVWELGADRLFSAFYTSQPSRILAYMWEISVSGVLWEHLFTTLYEVFFGFVGGALAGISLGFILARMRWLARILDPFIAAIYGIPKIALAPIFVIWFGIGITSKLIMAGLMVFFLTFMNTYAGVLQVSQELQNLARVMGASEWQVVRKVTLPASLPWVLTGLKTSVPNAIIGAVVGEFMVAQKGLGFMISQATGYFDTTGTFAGVIILAAMVVVGNTLLAALAGRMFRWHARTENPGAGGDRA